MAVLNSWQRIDRVVAGKPWGDGSAGNATISSDPNSRATASGSSGSVALTIGSAILSNGDVFLIHQTQGTGVGQWEINQVASGGGSTSITCSKSLQYTYGTGAQVIKIPLYNNVTVNAHSPSVWNGSIGGVEIICGRKTITVNGALTNKGGYRGGAGVVYTTAYGYYGENWTGASGNSGNYNAANDGGGGGKSIDPNVSNGSCGGGGGYSGSGGNGTKPGGGNAGLGGTSKGATDLATIYFGGGGGGGGGNNKSANPPGGNGGAGGGIVILISSSITLSAGVVVDGNTGGNGTLDVDGLSGGGGGGAGGAILMVCSSASLGSNLATSNYGGGGSGNGAAGGNGSTGMIAVHHSSGISGTTSPTYTDISDATLVEPTSGGAFLYNFI